ncbi:MAG: TetR/AcrR family transcriptional regulator [Sporomusaceae bacterium]|nr:TetR/AcrR family transcriptional regulator [Sporomusaceae bacterium]
MNDVTERVSRRDKIIQAAVALFEEAGTNGLTTKEIARRQAVTEPVIYKYFSGKKAIIAELLKCCRTFDEQIEQALQAEGLRGKKGIFYVMEQYGQTYEKTPYLSTILFSFDLFRYDSDLKENIDQLIAKRQVLFQNLVTQAVARNEMVIPMTSQAAADLFLGTLYAGTLRWNLEERRFNLAEWLRASIAVLFH